MRPHNLLLAISCAVCGVAAQAQSDYPSGPTRYGVASAPGGIADIPPRVLAPRLPGALRQAVVVETRPAGGIVAGGETVAKALPDGYTLLSATPQVAIVQSMVKDLAFDPRRDLAPIALVGVIPNVLVAGPRTPAKTLAELVDLARRNPGKLNYSSTGAGTSVHLSAELLKYYAGVDIVHVPYRGAAAAMTALLAGDVDIMVDSVPPSLPHIRAGKVRALAVTSARRVPQLPEVPTMVESGYKDFEINGWAGVGATAGPQRAEISEVATMKTLPKDIHPESRSRLPLPKREALDEQGRRVYDSVLDPKRPTLAGFQGPAGIWLHSPRVAEPIREFNRILRNEVPLEPRLRELAILVTAREFDSQFEWTAHEPVAHP